MDILIVVIEPGFRSIQTARAVKKMSMDLGFKSVFIVINKLKSEEEKKLLKKSLKDFKILGELPYSEKVRESDLKNYSPCDSEDKFKNAIEKIAVNIEKLISS